jgi:hypothetical protein
MDCAEFIKVSWEKNNTESTLRKPGERWWNKFYVVQRTGDMAVVTKYS